PCFSAVYFVSSSSPDHRDLHSFPTRRSSDLIFRSVCAEADVSVRAAADRRGVRSGFAPAGRLSHFAAHLRGSHLLPNRTGRARQDRKSTRLNSSHRTISYAVFCLKKKKNNHT